MNLEYILLPAGIALLVVPTSVVGGARVRDRLNQPARRFNEGLESLVRSRINWFDLIRGAAGGWLVQKPFQDSVSPQDELAATFLGVQLTIVFLGVLAQTIWFHKPLRVIGPVFFQTGLTLALSGPLTGGFALALGFSCALMFGRLSAVFSIVPVAIVGFGLLFREFGVMTAFNAAIYSFPAFLAFTFGTRISFVRRTGEDRVRKVRPAQGHRPLIVSEVSTVIRTDFAHPSTLAAMPAAASAPEPTPARNMADESTPVALPDFLRIAEDPEPPRARTRKKIFPLRRA